MRLKVKYLDGREADITVSASARHMWETEHGPLLDAMRSAKADWAHFLAHTTLSRSKAISSELLDWLDSVQAVEWEMPADMLAALADALGVKPTSKEPEAVPHGESDGTPTPTVS